MKPIQFQYITLAEVMEKLRAYMKSRNYSLNDYELTSVGHGCCTQDDAPTIWYYAFCLRELTNSDHEISINIPCYKSEEHVSYEKLSREYPPIE